MADVTKRRCIFISNLPPSISSSALESFLLQELESCNHDGSHLVKVMFPVNPSTPGLALVTFQDEKAMVCILRKRLVYEGEPLTTQPFLSYVFSSMSAVVNPDVSHLFPFMSPDFTCLMDKNCGVECRQLDEKERDRWMHISQISVSHKLFMLTGNWFQMQNARKFMQEWVVDEKKRSEFMDQNHNLKDETNQKVASSRKHSNSHKDMSQREKQKNEKRREKELATSLSSSVEEKRIHRCAKNGTQMEVKTHNKVTDSAGLLERNSPTGNNDSRRGKKDRSKAKREVCMAKVACRFEGESVQPSSGNQFEQEDLNVDAAPHLASKFAQDGVRQKGATSSEDITHHEDPVLHFDSSSQNSEHIRNHLAEISSNLSIRGVTPGEKIDDDSKTQTSPSVENGRKYGENSAGVRIPSRPPRSVDTRDHDLESVPSVDYMQYVKVPQTSISGSFQELNKSKEMRGNSKRSEDASMEQHKEDETMLTQREQPDVNEGVLKQRQGEGLPSQREELEVNEDCPGPLPATSSVSERNNVDEESEEPKESLGSLPVDPGVFSYILLKQSDFIREIEETYSVKFSIQTTRDGDDDDVESAMLKVRSLSELSDIATAHDRFVDLYTTVFSGLKHRVIAFEDTTIDPKSLDKTVESIHDVYTSVLILTVSNKKVLIYGSSESDVRLAKYWIQDAIKKQKRNTQTEVSGEVSETNAEDSVSRRVEYEQPVLQERTPRPHHQTEVDGQVDTRHSVIRESNNLSPTDGEPMIRPQGVEDTDGQVEHRFTQRRVDFEPVEQAVMNIPPLQLGTHQQQVDSFARMEHGLPVSPTEPEISAKPLPLNGCDVQQSGGLGLDRWCGPPEEASVKNKMPIVLTTTPASDAGHTALPSSEAVRSKVKKAVDVVSETELLPKKVETVSMTDTIPVDPGVYGYIQMKKQNILCDIEQNYNIKFSVEGDLDSDIYFIRVEANGAVSDQSIQQGKETFLNFYSEVFSGLVHRAIGLADFEGVSQEVLEETLQGAEHSFSDVYFRVVPSRFLIFGQGLHNVETARDFVLSRLRQSAKSLVEVIPHMDLDVSMDSLSNDEMMSRLNHLRFGSTTPDSLTGVANQRQTVTEANGRTGVEMIDQTIRHYAVTEESILKRSLTTPQDENKPNEETDQPKSLLQHGINNNMTVSSTGPSDILPHSGGKRDRTKNEENIYKFSDSRLLMQLSVSGIGVQVYPADITRIAVDAIVSAANEKLTNIGGVAATICHAAGSDVQADCNMLIARHGLLYPSEVKHTGAGRLPCKFILHAVGPRWHDYANEQECRQTLRSTIANCLRIADQKLQVTSLAMPLISSGIFGVPFEICLEEICEALREYNDNRRSIKILQQVHVVDLDHSTIEKAQDAMIHRLCKKRSGSEINLGTDEKNTGRGFLSQLDSGTHSHSTVRDYRLDVGIESSRRSRREHEPKRTSTRSSRSSIRHLDSSDEDVLDPISISLSRPVMARSTSLPYLARDDVKDHRSSCWSSETTDIMTTGNPRSFPKKAMTDTGQRSRSSSRTASKVSSQTRREDRINNLLEAHSKAPPSLELSRKTQYEINRILTEPIVTTRDRQRPKTRRSQSLDRTVSGDKCVVCSSQKNLSKRKSCEHFICEICKSARLDNGRCKQCSKLKSKKKKMCDLCTCSTDYMLMSCISCDNSICIKCIKKELDVCRDCSEQTHPLANGHGEKKRPKLREPIVVGTQPSHHDMKKSYRIKSSIPDLSSSRKKPMLGLSQSVDVSQSYSSSGRRNDFKTSGRTSSAFSQDFVTEDAPHDEMIRHRHESKGQEIRPQHLSEKGIIKNKDLTRSAQNPRKQTSRDKELNVIGKSSVLQPNPVTCVICMDKARNPKELSKCRHSFCAECIDKAFKFKPVCPICGESYGTLSGDQPDGTMTHAVVSVDLPGHPGCGTIIINYSIPNGLQTEDHPNPGMAYRGTYRQAFLPNSREGAEVLKLLQRAFDSGLLFTIDRSVTTGKENVVVWNDVHHKTRRDGGAEMHGYPDPSYLQRVRDELEAKGIH